MRAAPDCTAVRSSVDCRSQSPKRRDTSRTIVPGSSARPAQRAVASIRSNPRSEEHTSELQSLMRISYAVFCLKKKKINDKSTRTQPDSQYRNSQPTISARRSRKLIQQIKYVLERHQCTSTPSGIVGTQTTRHQATTRPQTTL